MTKSGKLLMTGGIVRAGAGTKLAYAGTEFSVTDGPFAESKELIDGFALVETESVAEAVEPARRFMAVAGEGEGESLHVFDADISPR